MAGRSGPGFLALSRPRRASTARRRRRRAPPEFAYAEIRSEISCSSGLSPGEPDVPDGLDASTYPMPPAVARSASSNEGQAVGRQRRKRAQIAPPRGSGTSRPSAPFRGEAASAGWRQSLSRRAVRVDRRPRLRLSAESIEPVAGALVAAIAWPHASALVTPAPVGVAVRAPAANRADVACEPPVPERDKRPRPHARSRDAGERLESRRCSSSRTAPASAARSAVSSTTTGNRLAPMRQRNRITRLTGGFSMAVA